MKVGSHRLKVEGVDTNKELADMTITELWSYVDYTGSQEASILLQEKMREEANKPVKPDWDRNIVNK